MAADDDWVVLKPGEEAPAAAGAGPSASEWAVIPPKGKLPPVPLTAGDAANLAYMGANSFTFGLGNRASAVGAALGKGTSYATELDRINEIDNQMRQRHPWLSMGAELAGGIGNAAALIRSGILKGAPAGADWLARGVQGAFQGGALGAAQGVGTTYSGIPSDYLHNAGMGAVLGAGMGAAAPAASSLVTAPVRAAADRGWFGGVPKEVAAAAQADAAGLRNLPNVPGAMFPDAGPSMKGVAQGAVTGTGGPGRSALVGELSARDAATAQRIGADINQTYGQAQVPSHVEAGIQARMRSLGNAYDQAFANARAVNPEQVALWIEGQIGRTADKAQDALRRVRADLDIPTNPGVLDPHPERMHAVRSGIKGILNDPNVDGNTKRVLAQVEQRLTQELHDKVPGIRQIDDAYAELGSQQRAITTGPDSAGARMFDKSQANVYRPVELAETLREAALPKGGNVGPSAEAFRLTQAGRAEVDRIIGTNKNDLLALENVLGQPQDWNAQKLAVMFGQDRANRLMDVLARERNFRQTYQDVVQGSQTAQRTAAKESLEAGQGKIPWDVTLTGTVMRGAQEGVNALRATAAANKRDAIAQLMATRNPAEIQRQVDRLLAAQPRRDMRQEMARRLIEGGMAGAPALAPSVTNR